RLFRRVEAKAATTSSAIVTLTEAARHELGRCYGEQVEAKVTVIPTCADLERFRPRPMPAGPPKLLLSGTFNALYDRAATVAVAGGLTRRLGARVSLIRPAPSSFDDVITGVGAVVGSAPFDQMPDVVANHHAGLVL